MERWHRKQLADVWPFYGLTIRTERTTLRLPTDADLLALAERSADVHGNDLQPIIAPWTGSVGAERERALLQHHWSQRAAWTPDHWDLDFAVTVDDEPVGVQALRARTFGTTRAVTTSSWLHRPHQGRGIGREVRAAVLHLAFAGLHAERASTETLASNAASIAVTERLGYRFNGDDVRAHCGSRRVVRRYVMDRDDWTACPRPEVEVTGLEPCLPLLGAAVPERASLPAAR